MVVELKNTFDGPFSRLERAQERINEFEVNRNFQNWNAKNKNIEQNIQDLWNIFRSSLGISNPSKGEQSRRYVLSNNDWTFSKINGRHQTTDTGSTKNTKQDV